MSTFKVQDFLDEQNLNLQELSERADLSVESIQDIGLRTQEVFADLQKIANASNVSVLSLLELTLRDSPDGGLPQWYCDVFPEAKGCQKS